MLAVTNRKYQYISIPALGEYLNLKKRIPHCDLLQEFNSFDNEIEN